MTTLRHKSRIAARPLIMAARIKAERLRLGLTCEEAARMLGISRSSYKQLECSANPQYSRLVELVCVLGMDAKAIAPELFDEVLNKERNLG